MNTKTLLVVDDDKLLQATFKALFERHSYHVLTANDGNEALAALETNHVDVVLLDILMPEKEGLETLLDIRRRLPKLPVIVISGGGTRSKHDFLNVATQFGANAVFKKPIVPADLLREVERQVGRVA